MLCSNVLRGSRPYSKYGARGLKKVVDSSGHEHASDGKFTSIGGASSAKASVEHNEKTGRSTLRLKSGNEDIGGATYKIRGNVASIGQTWVGDGKSWTSPLQGKGYGAKLYAALRDEFSDKGVQKVHSEIIEPRALHLAFKTWGEAKTSDGKSVTEDEAKRLFSDNDNEIVLDFAMPNNVKKVVDASGHEHAADGKFGSGGASSSKGDDKPKSAKESLRAYTWSEGGDKISAEHIKELSDETQAYFDNGGEVPTTVYRGIPHAAWDALANKKGETVHFRTLMSTSGGIGVAQQFAGKRDDETYTYLQFLMPPKDRFVAGNEVPGQSSVFQDEQEWILRGDMPWKVIGAFETGDEGHRVIRLKAAEPDAVGKASSFVDLRKVQNAALGIKDKMATASNLAKVKDETGHEHGADGKFSSGGGGGASEAKTRPEKINALARKLLDEGDKVHVKQRGGDGYHAKVNHASPLRHLSAYMKQNGLGASPKAGKELRSAIARHIVADYRAKQAERSPTVSHEALSEMSKRRVRKFKNPSAQLALATPAPGDAVAVHPKINEHGVMLGEGDVGRLLRHYKDNQGNLIGEYHSTNAMQIRHSPASNMSRLMEDNGADESAHPNIKIVPLTIGDTSHTGTSLIFHHGNVQGTIEPSRVAGKNVYTVSSGSIGPDLHFLDRANALHTVHNHFEPPPPYVGSNAPEIKKFSTVADLLKVKDASGHEHAADGKFGSGGASDGDDDGKDTRDPSLRHVPKKVASAFEALGFAQRGAPEKAMIACQHYLGGGELNYVIEHVGDLTHRMTQMSLGADVNQEQVSDKVGKTLRALKSPYGFQREVDGSIKSTAEYNGVDESDYRDGLKPLLDKYAEEHAKLPVYNEAQELARDAAVALGRQQWRTATAKLEALDKIANGTPEEWSKAAYAYKAGKDGMPVPLGEESREVAS
jgi:hypothetical protein